MINPAGLCIWVSYEISHDKPRGDSTAEDRQAPSVPDFRERRPAVRGYYTLRPTPAK